MDVDLMIALDQANILRFIGAAEELGMTPVVPVALAELADIDAPQRLRQLGRT